MKHPSEYKILYAQRPSELVRDVQILMPEWQPLGAPVIGKPMEEGASEAWYQVMLRHVD